MATDRPVAASVNHASCMIEPRDAPTMAVSTVSGEAAISKRWPVTTVTAVAATD